MRPVRKTGLFQRTWLLVVSLVLSLLASGCTVRLVQPYDEKLATDTEAVFKKASTLIDTGISKSPLRDEERMTLKPSENSEAHYSKFEAAYNSLNTDADALILRALAKSQDLSPIGDKLQKEIAALIDESVPSSCTELEAELGAATSSLTVKNYVDLKCLFVRWKDQHADKQFTQDSQILKRSNWEGRKNILFNAILAILKAEAVKQN